MPVGTAMQFNVLKWVDVLISPHVLPWHEATLVLLSWQCPSYPHCEDCKRMEGYSDPTPCVLLGLVTSIPPSPPSPHCHLSSPLSLPA